MKRNAIRGSIKGAAEYRPVILTFENEDGSSDSLECVARPVTAPPALARVMQKLESQNSETPDLTDAEALHLLEGVARLLSSSIREWDLVDEDGETIPTTFAEFSNWESDELLTFFAVLQKGLAETPKGK